MLPNFTPPFSKEVMDEAMSYVLSEEPDENHLPEGIDLDMISELHDRALRGDSRVIPVLKGLIRKHPEYPTLKNYLSAGLRARGKVRQAAEVERDTRRLHPEYLFGRIAEAQRLLKKPELEKVREILGQNLKLADVIPTGGHAHVSEWKSYYGVVSMFYCETGDHEAAQGIINALESRGIDQEIITQLTNNLMHSRLKQFQERALESKRNEIHVKCPPRPKRTVAEACHQSEHPAINDLYEFDSDFPQEVVDEILALPRDEAIRDLTAILENGIANAPFYFRDDDACWEQIHALFLLSEMKAEETLETVLRFLGQHPDFLDLYFGDLISWQPLIGIIGGDLPLLANWMKTPGLPYEGRSFAMSAVAELPVVHPERHGEAVAWLADLLAFLRDSPPADNILDTRLVADLVDCLIKLRATRHEALIRELYDKGYVSEFMIGSLDENLRQLTKPPEQKRRPGHDGMIPFYDTLHGTPEEAVQPNPPNPLFGQNLFGNPHPEPPTATVSAGRNDPCPCGSGKKFKKCCMKG